MVDNIIIAVDDSPEEAYRLFFETCADSIREKAVEVGVEHHRIGSTNLNAEYINETIQRINNTFAFSAFSHGTNTALVCGANEYISITENNYHFDSSLFYSFACLCGNNLKDELVRNGVGCFWGYQTDVNFCPEIPEFVDCATIGLKSLLDGDTLKVARETTNICYDAAIAELYVTPNSFVQMALLNANRDALVIVGEETFSLN